MKVKRIAALTALGLCTLLAFDGQSPAYAKDKAEKSASKSKKGTSTVDLLQAIEAEKAPPPPGERSAPDKKELVDAMAVESALEKKRNAEKAKPTQKVSSAKERAAEKGPGVLKKSFGLPPKGLKWGLSLEAIAQLYDKEIEAEMLPRFKKTQPGVELDYLNEELKNRKAEIRRSHLEFAKVPSGLDNTPLGQEYSYNNGESMASITTPSGTKRHFFFFNDRLWKVYDEHALSPNGSLGANFDGAIKSLTKRFGVKPKMQPADPEKGRRYPEAEWRDTVKLVRVIDRGQTLGIAYVERDVQEDLARYRRNKGGPGRFQSEPALDRQVQAVMRKPEAPPQPPDSKGKAKKKKK